MVNIDGEFLINDVQKRPLLWDTSNEDYKDKNKKNSAWFEIALSLLSNFNEENEAQQKLICKYFVHILFPVGYL